MKVYYRGTNNPHEPNIIASGQILHSFNHLTGTIEKGLSVSINTEELYNHFCIVYKVIGQESGYGSDGEILLNPYTVRLGL